MRLEQSSAITAIRTVMAPEPGHAESLQKPFTREAWKTRSCPIGTGNIWCGHSSDVVNVNDCSSIGAVKTFKTCFLAEVS